VFSGEIRETTAQLFAQLRCLDFLGLASFLCFQLPQPKPILRQNSLHIFHTPLIGAAVESFLL